MTHEPKTIAYGVWSEPICCFCGERIEATNMPLNAPQFIPGPKAWAHAVCWHIRAGERQEATQRQEAEQAALFDKELKEEVTE